MTNIVLNKYSLKENRVFIIASWQALLATSEHSYFQSVEWINTWFKHLPDHQDIDFWLMSNKNEPIAALFIGRCTRQFMGIKSLNRGIVQGIGIEKFDLITPEYTGFVCPNLSQIDVELWSSTLLNTYHEVVIPYVAPEQALLWLKQKGGSRLYDEATYFADLTGFKDGESAFWQSISKNTKKQLKTSLNAYEKIGTLQVTAAVDKRQALAFLQELGKLSSLKWATTNKTGAFDQQQFVDFHQDLIRGSFDNGQIQLLKITAGDHVIGYLYNFVYQSTVHFYQCGFVYQAQNKFRPGLVCHYLSMKFNADKDVTTYDFLAGDNRYKQSLATKKIAMPTLLLQRNSWFLTLESRVLATLKRIKHFKRSV